jgi:hypothetical protein
MDDEYVSPRRWSRWGVRVRVEEEEPLQRTGIFASLHNPHKFHKKDAAPLCSLASSKSLLVY